MNRGLQEIFELLRPLLWVFLRGVMITAIIINEEFFIARLRRRPFPREGSWPLGPTQVGTSISRYMEISSSIWSGIYWFFTVAVISASGQWPLGK